MKKWICTLLCALLMLTPVMISAESDATKVEISFCVGDSTLSINGAEMQVETPYVVGVGVTLVPLRVITEAFGATVEWVAETQTILLSYPDVNITLQIGNTIAEVNGKAEALLSAPELTANGFTMVPLRFISETFGAEVSYDSATAQITVVKESITQEGSMVQGAIEQTRVGDSYYGWSMDTPSDMEMKERTFDGLSTIFEKDENNGIEISISTTPKDYDFDRDYIEAKDSLKGLTLVAADKDAEKKLLHFQAKNKNFYYEFYQYATDAYIYLAYGIFDATNAEIIKEGNRLLKSFDLSFAKDETYDLSNVHGKTRTFSADHLNFKIDIPKDFFLSSSEDALNEFTFHSLSEDDDISRISIGIYSASAVGDAQAMAKKDYANNKKYLNPELASFSTITQQIYTNITTYEYYAQINSVAEKYYYKDAFFSKGAYVYNVSIELKLPDDNTAVTTNAILNSVVADMIDSDQVGILMRNDPEYGEGTYTVKGDKWSIQVPTSYLEILNTGDVVTLADQLTGTIMQICTDFNDNIAFKDIMSATLKYEKELKNDKEITILKPTEQIKIDDARFAELLYCRENEESKVYMHELAGLKGWKSFTVSVIYEELTYSKDREKETKEILATLTVE